MKKSLILVVAVLFSAIAFSQTITYMRVMQGDSIVYSEDIAQIDSVVFADENISAPIPEGALSGEFSVSPTKKIRFSQGNLQFNPAQGSHHCADGTTQQGTWRFAEHQWDIVKTANDNAIATYDGWLDLFAWGTSGYNGKYPYLTNASYSDSYFINSQQNISGTMLDWGLYNEISNGGTYGTWRTPTASEYEYLFTQRQNATNLYMSDVVVNGVEGLLLCPDDWDASNILRTSYSLSEWELAETQGLVFLPYAGVRDFSLIGGTGWFFVGYYWSGTCGQETGKAISLDTYSLQDVGHNEHPVSHGRSVRLVQDAIIPDVPSTSGNVPIVHDTIIKIVHDTIYIRDCNNLTDRWTGFIVEANEDNTVICYNTFRTTDSSLSLYDPSATFDCSTIEGNLWYSFDAQTWNEWMCGDSIILHQGQQVCLKGNRQNYCILDRGRYRLVVTNGSAKGYGYISSLFDNSDQYTTTSFGDHALTEFFEGNFSIKLSFPEGVTNIGTNYTYSYSFRSFTPSSNLGYGYTAIELPSSLQYLGCTCFEWAAFEEITIPRAVSYIGFAAFNQCKNLETVNYLGTIAEWNSITKGNYKHGSAVPASVVHCLDGDAPF